MESTFFGSPHFGEFSTPPGQGTPDEKRLSSKLFRRPQNRLQTLLLGLAGPWAKRRIPIFGGRVLPRGCPIDGGFRSIESFVYHGGLRYSYFSIPDQRGKKT